MLRPALSSSTRRAFSVASTVRHENPLGLPRRPALPPRPGPPVKRAIPHVKRVIAVASGKGGVGKSTTAVNLAFALAAHRRGARVGVLDLDIFGPSVPRLMGLGGAPEPLLTSSGALVPLASHGLTCMSMGFLLPRPKDGEDEADTPVVWRGLMVQKAVQQLLFDVDWREGAGAGGGSVPGAGLDVLVLDMPPGTGDVPLTLGQLVHVHGSVIVSTPQSVALDDVRKGLSTFSKLSIPLTGLLLNTAHTYCPSCATPHPIFGSPGAFTALAERRGLRVLGALPLVPGVGAASDAGVPYALWRRGEGRISGEGEQRADAEWVDVMGRVAGSVWESLDSVVGT